MENADRIGERLGALCNLLDDENTGILLRLKENETALLHIAADYPSATEFAERLRSVAIELKDICSTASDDMERIESNPARLDEINDRLDALYSLCRKHRTDSVAELIGVRDELTARLNAIIYSDETIAQAEQRTAD